MRGNGGPSGQRISVRRAIARYRLTSKGHQINAALSATRQTSLKRLIGTHPTPA